MAPSSPPEMELERDSGPKADPDLSINLNDANSRVLQVMGPSFLLGICYWLHLASSPSA